MIKINNKQECCGCGACFQKCPKGAIELQEDSAGFKYPVVNTTLCIDCGLCEKVCPCLNPTKPRNPLRTFAAFNNNQTIRKESSSGGVFTVLAEKVIKEGGVVFGAIFDDNWTVTIAHTDNLDELAKFRGSKYVQASTANSFKDCECFLKEGRSVLFSGTPCQLAGLRHYLRKDYDNLITVDFICHGVPSPGVFRWYLQEELNTIARKGNKNTVSLPTIHSIPKGDVRCPDGLELRGIRFRDKCTGWKKFSFALDLAKATADGEKIQFSLSKDLYKNPYLRGFLWDLYLRPSCHFCKAKSLSSGADMTIGDFWGIESVVKKYNDDKGVSCVLANSPKAISILDSIDLSFTEVSFDSIAVRNTALNESTPITSNSQIFWNSEGLSFVDRVKKATHESFRIKLIKAIKLIYFNLYVKPFKL